MVDANAIDLSKENIQPLRHGRKTHLLGLALQAQTDDEIQKQLIKKRDEFELLIRFYDGPDPLQPRYDYVLWLEQCYPKHGRESNLIPLLEDTITIFKNDERYLQDPRFVELIVKFIETQVNPLELYQVVYNLGIGTKCTLFYKSWAEEFDNGSDVKRADQILSLGISNRAEPLDVLKQEQKQFQLSVGRRLLNGEELNQHQQRVGPSDNSRQVLGKLKSKVGSTRSTFGKAGVVPLCLSNRNLPQKSNAPLAVYQDSENNDPGINTVDNYDTEQLPKSDLAKKENSMKPGPWTKAYKPPKARHTVHPVHTPSTPSFKVHEDLGDVSPAPATPMSVCPSALKPRKCETFHCPVAVFEPPDPSIKPMYCKNKIYVGGREFQMEEIKAAMYYKKIQRQTQMEEMEKLGLKLADSSLACLTTPQALRKIQSSSCTQELATPYLRKEPAEFATPFACTKPREFTTPSVGTEPMTPLAHNRIKEPVTPFNILPESITPHHPPRHYQPITPFDLPSNQLQEITMDGTETAKKLNDQSQLPLPANDNKPIPNEPSNNVKKFLNFAVFCDD